MDETFGVDPSLFASTYTIEQLITTLYLENLQLKRLHPIEVPPSPYKILGPKKVQADEYAMARTYAAGLAGSGERHLVLANDYPKLGSEYGNGFVHRRVKAYQAYGANVDVVAFGPKRDVGIYEYDGVRVLSGYVNELLGLLSLQQYASISVHFLNQFMWDVLWAVRGTTKVVVFLHGYEVDRWIRRDFQYSSSLALQNAIERSLRLQSFWQHVMRTPELEAQFVFVSRWWRTLVSEDMEVVIPDKRSSVIHNVIDTDLFDYREKAAEDRFKILWVRSAGSLKYGPDLAVSCLKVVRESEYWPRVSVRIIGDGGFFHLFEDEFRNDPNVVIERRFVPQDEIARLHKQHGISLTPTRYDAQGVSRDEAMSSGLVPVTNAVAAIPEFVDDSCAILGPAEDGEFLGKRLVDLFADPDRFLAMSRAAAERVRGQCGPDQTVRREAELLGIVGAAVS